MTAAAHPDQDDFERYLHALAGGDRRAALDVVRERRAAGEDALAILTSLVGPAQRRVGELWASDEWSVAQEHAGTAISEAVVTALSLEAEAPPADAPQVLVSCVEQEWHALPALLVSEHLRAAGVNVNYLGANASPEHLVRHTLDVGPSAVLLSCSLSSSLLRVRRHIEAVRETGTPVMVGGGAFDEEGRRAAALGANAFARTGAEAATMLESLPSAVLPAPPLTHPGAIEAAIVHAERETTAAAVTARVLQSVGAEDAVGGARSSWRTVLADQTPYLVGSVAGALLTDDPGVLHDALAWLATVLAHRGAPSGVDGALREGLAAALREHPEAGRLLARTT